MTNKKAKGKRNSKDKRKRNCKGKRNCKDKYRDPHCVQDDDLGGGETMVRLKAK